MAIPEFFDGQTVLLTGGTGFVGKVLLEKLLRSCPGVKRVYLTIRPKKGVSAEERWQSISSVPLFDKLKQQNPEALSKVYLINADMKKPDLGISDSDKEILINEVNIVFHVAATVQFTDNIIEALSLNTRATYILAELSKRMKNLKVFVYASTTYSNFNRPESDWDEKIYPAIGDWRVMLKLLDTELDNLPMLQEKLLCGHPNPYTYSKSLAENIIDDYKNDFTCVIVRPSIVMATLEEPLVGWIDSLNGMAALWIAYGLGILRVARHNDEAHQDYIPVCSVAKALIIAAWATYKNKDREQETPVYNCTIGKLITIKTSDLSKYSEEMKFVDEWPSKYIVWTRDLQLIENVYKYHLLFFLRQLLPACILDTGIYLYGGKPIFITIAKKLAYSTQRLFKDFVLSKVHFPNERCLGLNDMLEEHDRQDFEVTQCKGVESYNVGNEIRNGYLGVLKYIFKEDLSKESLEKNRKRYQRIKMLQKIWTILYYSGVGWLGYKFISALPVTQFIPF